MSVSTVFIRRFVASHDPSLLAQTTVAALVPALFIQVCYNLVNFLQRDEQDKQARVDYLKNLAKEEADAEQVK